MKPANTGARASRAAKQKNAPPTSEARSVTFAPLVPPPESETGDKPDLKLVHDVPLTIRAVLGRAAMSLRDVVALQPGTVFELDKGSGEPVDLYVNDVLIARGEVVVVDEKFGVKIAELSPSAV